MTLEEFENMEEGWVEWPTFDNADTDEIRFDWSLSYQEMEKLYGREQKKKHTVIVSEYRHPPLPKAKPKSAVTEKKEQRATGKFVHFMGVDCPCVGFICDGNIPGVRKYQDAYYHGGDELYIFNTDKGLRGWSKAFIGKFIRPFYPDAADVTLSVNTNLARPQERETVDQVAARKLAEAEHNFHENC